VLLLKSFGLIPSDLGVHSIRKGSATYSVSGTTSAPSHNSVKRRAGWSYGGSEDRYLQIDAAGDQYVGRIVCGLNPLSADFGLLPPHFNRPLSDDELILVFPSLGKIDSLKGVLHFLIASVVFHIDFLQSNLKPGCSFFQSALANPAKRAIFQPSLVSGHVSSIITPTGLPPHVVVIQLLSGVRSDFSSMQTELSKMPDAVSDCLRDRSFVAENLSAETLLRSITETLDRQVNLTITRALGERRLGSEREVPNSSVSVKVFFSKSIMLYFSYYIGSDPNVFLGRKIEVPP